MPQRVLVVDDDASVRRLLEAALPLGDADVQVVGSATDGEEALEQVRRLRPDIVVLDHIMPNRTGASVVAALLEADPALQVILFSGFVEALEPGEELRRIADRYGLALVPKGNVRELEAAVARAARLREGARRG